MRQVFASPRLENVEAVAEMLRAEGIEVKITDGRSYRGNRRSTFSYRGEVDSGKQPAVWIVNADDQPRARQMLRDAGLLASSREGASSYLPVSKLREEPGVDAARRRRTRIRLALLGLIAVVGALIVFTRHGQQQAATETPAAPKAAVIVPHEVGALQEYRADVPTALAKKLVEQALAERAPGQACIGVDGKDPLAALMDALGADKARLHAASACPAAALAIEVSEYLTDGSGIGTVRLSVGGAARVLEVEREGSEWRVLGERKAGDAPAP